MSTEFTTLNADTSAVGRPALDLAMAQPQTRRWHASTEFVMALALIGDAVLVFAGMSLGFWLRFHSNFIPLPSYMKVPPSYADYLNLLALGSVFLIATFGYLRVYSQYCFLRYFHSATLIAKGTIFWLFAYMALSFTLKFDPPISRLVMVLSGTFVLAGMLLWRLFYLKVVFRGILAGETRQRVLFVGWGSDADKLAWALQNDGRGLYEVVGCLPSPQGRLSHQISPWIHVLGDYQHLPALLDQRVADMIILADLQANMGEIIGLVNLCEQRFVQFKVIPSYFQTLASGLRLETISGVPVLGVSELPLDNFSNRITKRIIDVAGAIVGLLLSAPLIAIMAWLIYRESPGNVFFAQERIGRGGAQVSHVQNQKYDARG